MPGRKHPVQNTESSPRKNGIYSLLHNCVPQRIAHGVAFAFELE